MEAVETSGPSKKISPRLGYPAKGKKKRPFAKKGRKAAKAAKNGQGEFGPKIGHNIGKEIEARYLKGDSLAAIARDKGVTVQTIKHHFFQYLLQETYEDAE